ncbi:hypothetical protein D5086_019647 [Populus alba]|uniref:Uncharacterized protein n=1 Tax=Populus alba TaxID=43335 RepID=A0ACC4BHS7_POPAL
MDGKGYENGFDVRNHYYGGPQKSIFSLQILCPTDTLGTSHKKPCCFWLSRTWTFVNLNENEAFGPHLQAGITLNKFFPEG